METLRFSTRPLDLVDVRIETKLGAHYAFPDMARDTLEDLLSGEMLLQGSLVFANVSQAVLVIPVRIIKTLSVNGEVKWSGIDLSELQE